VPDFSTPSPPLLHPVLQPGDTLGIPPHAVPPGTRQGPRAAAVPRQDAQGSASPPRGCSPARGWTQAATDVSFTHAPEISAGLPGCSAWAPRGPIPRAARRDATLRPFPSFSRTLNSSTGPAQPWLWHPQPPPKSLAMASGREV